ncbi:Der GTPase-activating protein YihI [Vibrio sp.]|nr:Der GTPase-activating protein YihI [Vibrio sp.]
MSRSKKARSGDNLGVIVVRNRTQSDVEGRLRKKDKKRKGLDSGNRHSDTSESKKNTANQRRDPRLGSKKKIPLIVEAPKKLNKQERRVTAEKELEMLENDAQLMVLLTRIENGEKLGAGLQQYVDQKLDRMEALMKQLGLYEEEAVVVEQEEVQVKKPKPTKVKPATDDDLLSQFEDLNMDDFKGF